MCLHLPFKRMLLENRRKEFNVCLDPQNPLLIFIFDLAVGTSGGGLAAKGLGRRKETLILGMSLDGHNRCTSPTSKIPGQVRTNSGDPRDGRGWQATDARPRIGKGSDFMEGTTEQ